MTEDPDSLFVEDVNEGRGRVLFVFSFLFLRNEERKKKRGPIGVDWFGDESVQKYWV